MLRLVIWGRGVSRGRHRMTLLCVALATAVTGVTGSRITILLPLTPSIRKGDGFALMTFVAVVGFSVVVGWGSGRHF
jgi:hypothetical protein